MFEWMSHVRSSSILVTVRRIVSASVLYLMLAVIAGQGHAFQAQEGQDVPKPSAFFAGTVVDFTSSKITVSRVVLGETQKRTFRITPDTKIDGKLRAKVRVTVQYTTDEEGVDQATLIIVRTAQQSKQKGS